MDYSTNRVVTDTDVLIDFLRGKSSAVEKLKELVESGASLATTVVNVFELSWGAYRIGRTRDVENLIEALLILSLTSKEALKTGEEAAYLASIGQTIDVRDLLIGIIARENGFTVLTGNIKHFSKIRGLRILSYKHE